VFRVAVVGSVLAAAAVAASASTAGSGGGTVVHRFQSFKDGAIAPGVHVTEARRGYCWTTSDVESRRYAWRCFRGNHIHDPCFSSARRAQFVLCPVEPWSSDVLRLRLTRALPPWQQSSYNPRFPAGVWTTTGKRCIYADGATSEIEGKPITYGCLGGGGVLVGFANRSSRTWAISYARSYKAHRLSRVGITEAWW
jgi:hypothetical protein